MNPSADTQELLDSLDEFRTLPVAIKEMIRIAKAEMKEISKENRAELIFGVGRVVAVMREVADEIERVMKEFEAEGA